MEDESQIHLHASTLLGWCLIAGMIIFLGIFTFSYSQINTPSIITDTSATDADLSVQEQNTAKDVHDDRRYPTTVYEMKNESELHSIIERIANRYEIDPALIKAIVMVESSYNSRAVSKSGARGLMQLMPSTAEALGVEDIFNPEHNIIGGVRYFKQLLNRYNGNIKLALAAYNAGSGKVEKYNGIPPYKATHTYIAKVIKYYQYYKGENTERVEAA
jgi:soluble lytic murein transglycosylase-like protein